MYSIRTEAFGDFNRDTITNLANGEFVMVLPDFGLALNQFAVSHKGKLQHVLFHTNDPKEYIEKHITKFSGSKLFPFPNRIKDAQYSYQNKRYKLPVNDDPRDNALHQFVFDKKFCRVSFDEKQGIASYRYTYDGSFDYFPFPFELEIQIQLLDHELKITSKVTNTGESTMPAGDGYHPYISTGTKVDQLSLQVPGNQFLETADLIPTSQFKKIEKFNILAQIGTFHFDDCCCIGDKIDLVQTKLYDPTIELMIELWQESGVEQYNYIQYYTPPDRMSIAIEPMSCAPNAINNNMGLIHLQPTSSRSFSFGIKAQAVRSNTI